MSASLKNVGMWSLVITAFVVDSVWFFIKIWAFLFVCGMVWGLIR